MAVRTECQLPGNNFILSHVRRHLNLGVRVENLFLDAAGDRIVPRQATAETLLDRLGLSSPEAVSFIAAVRDPLSGARFNSQEVGETAGTLLELEPHHSGAGLQRPWKDRTVAMANTSRLCVITGRVFSGIRADLGVGIRLPKWGRENAVLTWWGNCVRSGFTWIQNKAYS